jgi:hypothetical protein
MAHIDSDPNDPSYQPNGGGGKRKAPPKAKPFAWLSDSEEPANIAKLNAILNYVEYRASPTVDSPAIRSAAHACGQLLRKDLPFRSRLNKAASRQGQSLFVHWVRQGLRWMLPSYQTGDSYTVETDYRPGPFYTYLGAGAHTPTTAEHADWLRNNPPPAAATATAVLAGTPIPPRPDCPDDPGPPPAKPEGNRYPAKHPFTQAELDDFFKRNPKVSLQEMCVDLYHVPKQPVEEGMRSAMLMCCRLITPLKVKENMLEWTKRIAADVRWQGRTIDFQITGDSDSTCAVCFLAFNKGIKVMAPLDYGPVPPKEVTQAQEDEYHRLKRAHDEAVQAYKYAQRQLRAYDKKYGALARAVIPPAPDESEVCVTGHTTWADRDAELRKRAVDLSGDDDEERPAKQARIEPAAAPATGGMDIDKLAEALGVPAAPAPAPAAASSGTGLVVDNNGVVTTNPAPALALGEVRPIVKAEQ